MNNLLPRPRFWADAAEQCKTRRSLLGELLILLLLYVISYMIQSLLLAGPVTVWALGTQGETMLAAFSAGDSVETVMLRLLEAMPDWMAVAALFSTAAMGVAAVIYCTRFQKRSLASMGLGRRGAAGESVLGLGAGLALFGAVLALGAATGGYRLAAAPDLGQLLLVVLALLGCAVRGASVCLLVQGYFAPTVGARAPALFTLFISALFPAMLQAGGTLLSMTAVNALLLGLLLGVWTLKRGSLWGACGLCAAWTFAGSFLFDVAPAGAHGSIRVWEVEADALRPLLSGGVYGPMESICTTVVLLAALALSLALPAKDPAPTP